MRNILYIKNYLLGTNLWTFLSNKREVNFIAGKELEELRYK